MEAIIDFAHDKIPGDCDEKLIEYRIGCQDEAFNCQSDKWKKEGRRFPSVTGATSGKDFPVL